MKGVSISRVKIFLSLTYPTLFALFWRKLKSEKNVGLRRNWDVLYTNGNWLAKEKKWTQLTNTHAVSAISVYVVFLLDGERGGEVRRNWERRERDMGRWGGWLVESPIFLGCCPPRFFTFRIPRVSWKQLKIPVPEIFHVTPFPAAPGSEAASSFSPISPHQYEPHHFLPTIIFQPRLIFSFNLHKPFPLMLPESLIRKQRGGG